MRGPRARGADRGIVSGAGAVRKARRFATSSLAAWGNPNGVDEARYARRIGEVMVLLRGKEVNTVGLTKKGHPRHGLGWGVDVTRAAAAPRGRRTACSAVQ